MIQSSSGLAGAPPVWTARSDGRGLDRGGAGQLVGVIFMALFQLLLAGGMWNRLGALQLYSPAE